jgi:hypothetical protein
MVKDTPSRRPMRDGSELRDILSSPRRSASAGCGEPSPGSTYEAVTREMVHSLRGEVRDVKTRINQLLTLIIGAILLEVLMRLIGM